MSYLPNILPAYQPQPQAQTQDSQQLPVTQAVPQEEPLVLEEGSPKSSADTLESRSTKIKYGLGDLLGKTKDEIYQNLQDGQEDQLRAQAASTIDARKRQASADLITRTTANKQGPLTDDERNGLISIVQDMSKDTDPSTVFETAYGKQFIATLDRAAEKTPDNIWTDVQQVHPEFAAQLAGKHAELITKQQVIDTMIEDTQDTLKNQGYLGYGYDIAKTMIPGYTDYQLRGLAPGVGQLTGIGLSENLDEQRKTLMRLPTDEMATQLKTIVKSMEANPQLQMQYLQAMKGLSSDEAFIQDWTLPLDIAGTGVGGKLGKAAVRLIRGGKETDLLRQAEVAVQDMSKAASLPGASKSTIEAAAGDLTESAVTRATTNATADANAVPMATRRGIEALSSTHRADQEAVRANPGRFGQDMVNRIEERGDSMFSNLMDAALNVQKNERLPDVLSNESAVRLIVEDMRGKYRDLKNSIIDTSKIYKENLSNTYLIDFLMGHPDGTYFAQKSVAENWMEFHGLKGAVEEGRDINLTKTGVEQAKITKDIEGAQGIIDRNTTKASDQTLKPEDRAKAQEQIDLANDFIKDRQTARRPYTSEVDQQGLGFYVRITKPVDETRPAIRDALAQTTNTKLPNNPITFFLRGWAGRYAGAAAAKFRTPEEVLSLAERQNRLTSTYAPGAYFSVLANNTKEIRGLVAGRFSKGRKRWEEWQRGLENAQELPDPLDADRKGYFFKDPVEMEGYWQQWFHRLPDEQETAAYFEFKRGMEFDRVLRNIAEHRNQSRVGAETHNIILSDAAGKEIKSPDFNGVIRNKIPGSQDSIAVFTNKVGEERVVGLAKQSTAVKAEWQKEIDAGTSKLIELYDPKLRPLSGYSGLTDERVRYVLVPNVETRELDWNHVVRRGGGHIQYDYDYYIKQAKIRADEASGAHWYEGDTTVMAVPLEGIGKRVAEHLNKVRELLKGKNEVAAKEYSNKNLHVGWDEVKSWFVGYKDENGVYQVPRLSLNEDIHVVPNNRKVIDHDNTLRTKYSDFRDGTREGSLSAQSQVEFNQERDAFELQAVNVEGTKANPLYKVAPADKVDPIITMNRGLARIAKSNFMDDYKTMAVEHWLQQAKNYLDVKTIDQIYHSPFYYFNKGEFLSNTPADVKLSLEASRYHTQQLTGQMSTTDALLHSAAQKLADSAFNAFGPKGLVITPTWALPILKDPFAFARSIAFNMKLGLFNIPQFIVQAGNYANILGIAGYKYASTGTMAAQLHFWSTVNSHPNIINHLDTIASKFYLPGASQWRPGEFKEAFQEMMNSGFGHVGGEMAVLDNMMSTKLVDVSGLGKVVDWGAMPFKQGETNARYGAWYTAFKEFRDANPVGRITNADRATILQRADLLNVNMSRASSSAIHKGIWSIPTQFYTYQIRLTELMMGSRLTGVERARLFATNAALFGVPMATGMTSLPIADYLRQKAVENGYVVGDDYFKSMLMEGIPSAIGALITGKGDPQAGTWYDVGPRFGTKGLEFLGSATGSPDKGWLDVIGGPIYSIAKDTIKASDGLAYAIGSMMKGDQEVFPMVVEDVADVFKEITSFNSAWRIYAASQFGRWVSKNDAYLTDTSAAQAAFSSVFGVKDVNINDIQIISNSIKSQADYEKRVEEQFRQEFRRGMLAQNDNPELAKRFFTRAQAWLAISGYREDRISSVMSKALGDNESVMDKTNFDFYIRKTPDDQAQTRYDAMRKKLKIQEKRGE